MNHNLYVCSGPGEHPIHEEGDVEPIGQRETLDMLSQFDRIDVLRNLGQRPRLTGALYGDPDFEGFD